MLTRFLLGAGALTFASALLAQPAPAPAPREQERIFHPLPDCCATGAPESAVRVIMAGGQCSGTCIATDGKESLVLSCNHCFSADHLGADIRNPTAYPQAVRVKTLDGSRTLTGRAVRGSSQADMGLVVVEGVLPVATINPKVPPAGTPVTHYGITSGPASGKVKAVPSGYGANPTQQFRSDLTSIPGDSGAGVFAGNELVAVNWGYWSNKDQGGTPIKYAVDLLASDSALAARFKPTLAGQEPPPKPTPPPASPPTAKGVSLTVPAGSVVVIVGPGEPRVITVPAEVGK